MPVATSIYLGATQTTLQKVEQSTPSSLTFLIGDI
ncbi:MAG: hypothetical protein ACI90V_009469 [Bacillariaceae sp.]|jgi:hypothetical protein